VCVSAIAFLGLGCSDFEVMRVVAHLGDGHAQYRLAHMYADGSGVAKDDEAAARWLERAAEGDVAQAQYELGTQIVLGIGVPADPEAGTRWLLRAAGNGLHAARTDLGLAYLRGKSVPLDESEGVRHLRLAADAGEPKAQNTLAVFLLDRPRETENAARVGFDRRAAVDWLQESARSGFPAAQYNLGLLYAQGRGVQADPAQARAWYQRAAAQGHVAAGRELERVPDAERGAPRPGSAVPEPAAREVASGRALYEDYDCAGCHETAARPGMPVRPLVKLAERFSAAQLAGFLAAPPAPMPALPLSDAERERLAEYLLETYP